MHINRFWKPEIQPVLLEMHFGCVNKGKQRARVNDQTFQLFQVYQYLSSSPVRDAMKSAVEKKRNLSFPRLFGRPAFDVGQETTGKN